MNMLEKPVIEVINEYHKKIKVLMCFKLNLS